MITNTDYPLSVRPGKIEITVLIGGDPPTPARRQVVIFRETSESDGAMEYPGLNLFSIKRSKSDGTVVFYGLDEETKHTIIGYDHTGEFDPVIKGGLIPEPTE